MRYRIHSQIERSVLRDSCTIARRTYKPWARIVTEDLVLYLRAKIPSELAPFLEIRPVAHARTHAIECALNRKFRSIMR